MACGRSETATATASQTMCRDAGISRLHEINTRAAACRDGIVNAINACHKPITIDNGPGDLDSLPFVFLCERTLRKSPRNLYFILGSQSPDEVRFATKRAKVGFVCARFFGYRRPETEQEWLVRWSLPVAR